MGARAVELMMTAPLSQDLRERIAHAVEGGSTMRQAARRFAVSASAAIKLMERVRQTGSTAPAKIGGHRRPILEPHADTLRTIATSKAGIREIKAALAARGIVVKALSTIADMLHRLGLSHKKTRSAKLTGTLAVPRRPGRHPGCGGSGCAGSGHAAGGQDAGGVRSIAPG